MKNIIPVIIITAALIASLSLLKSPSVVEQYDDSIDAEIIAYHESLPIKSTKNLLGMGYLQNSLNWIDCVETDSSINVIKKGVTTAKYIYDGAIVSKEFEDTCNGNRLVEYSCKLNRPKRSLIDCLECNDGFC